MSSFIDLSKRISEALTIPPATAFILLPARDKTVSTLLSFALPPVTSTPASEVVHLNTKDYVVLSALSIVVPTLSELRALGIPSHTVVLELLRYVETVLDGADPDQMYVRYAHLPGPLSKFPLWVLSYWKEVHDLQDQLVGWRRADRWLQSKERSLDKDEALTANQVRRGLWDIPWSATCPSLVSDSSATSLSTFLSRDWLSSAHVQMMLDVLKDHPNLPPDVTLHGSTLLDYIQASYVESRDQDKPQGLHALPLWLRKTSQTLFMGKGRIGAPVHVHGNHWVSIVVNFSEHAILYGDPAGHPMPAFLACVLQWWTLLHDRQVFEILDLPCSTQDMSKDWFSCGVRVLNDLAFHFIPSQHTLMCGDDGDLARMRALLDIITRGKAKVFARHILIARLCSWYY